MMSPDLTSFFFDFLTQAPFIAILLWLWVRREKEHTATTERQNDRIDGLAQSLDNLSSSLDDYVNETRERGAMLVRVLDGQMDIDRRLDALMLLAASQRRNGTVSTDPKTARMVTAQEMLADKVPIDRVKQYLRLTPSEVSELS